MAELIRVLNFRDHFKYLPSAVIQVIRHLAGLSRDLAGIELRNESIGLPRRMAKISGGLLCVVDRFRESGSPTLRLKKHARRPATRLEIDGDVHLSVRNAKAACFQN